MIKILIKNDFIVGVIEFYYCLKYLSLINAFRRSDGGVGWMPLGMMIKMFYANAIIELKWKFLRF